MRNDGQARISRAEYPVCTMRSSTRLDYLERVNLVVRLLLASLDEAPAAGQMATAASLSRFHFHRVFRQTLGETPGGLRRRLLLERSAYMLTETRASVTAIAIESGFDSLEAFSRAFRRAYGLTPSAFRLMERSEFRLCGASGVHFQPLRAGSRHSGTGAEAMDLVERLIDHDAWTTRQMLLSVRGANESDVDRPLQPHGKSVRELLERAVWQKEMWVAAMDGVPLQKQTDRSIDGLLKRMDAAFPRFGEIARRVRDSGQWDAMFVDGVCEPAETFSYGGAFAHVITHAAYRRQVLLDALDQIGIRDIPYADPIKWEPAAVAAAAA